MTPKKKEVDINEIIFGIRFQRFWHILDITGDITDKILRGEKSPFSNNYFTKVGDLERGKKLFNDETGCSSVIATDDLIFKHVFDDKKEELKGKDIGWFFNTIVKFIIPELLIFYKIRQIMRMGVLYLRIVDAESISKELIDTAVGEIQGETTKFNLDFHKKIPLEKSLAKKGVNDYKNIIYSIENIDEKKYRIGLDYQYYFKPYIDHLGDWKKHDFLEKSHAYLNETFYPWLKEKLKV